MRKDFIKQKLKQIPFTEVFKGIANFLIIIIIGITAAMNFNKLEVVNSYRELNKSINELTESYQQLRNSVDELNYELEKMDAKIQEKK
ncbi:hypothetical protein LI064_02265 [Clostridium perfringens]|uniref:hypothetical protein n=1 Tax=Clostridium perfringens TaxID=1502 RepID=UPI002245AD4B|nr:hypothetical protein [Clostridium perfringens]MCX0353346.1 hypothetical protein [Clostridium perfringens]